MATQLRPSRYAGTSKLLRRTCDRHTKVHVGLAVQVAVIEVEKRGLHPQMVDESVGNTSSTHDPTRATGEKEAPNSVQDADPRCDARVRDHRAPFG